MANANICANVGCRHFIGDLKVRLLITAFTAHKDVASLWQ